MGTTPNGYSRLLAMFVLVAGAVGAGSVAHARDEAPARERSFQVTSPAFTNGGVLPLSAIDNIVAGGVNSCTANGAAGGDQSPALAWTHAPAGTRSFVVTVFDVTASFTHWGMYNIPASATGLPENAGVAGSALGTEVANDFGAAKYDGPCPPANVPPDVHHYVFTVYALDTTLHLRGSANFPANAETLYQALLAAAEHDHILARASITGTFSSTP
jgi:Raf kinase inhibitor-like YbhB/YbcL family protein